MPRLVPCGACSEPMSIDAKQCPKCGHPAPKRTGLGTWLTGGVASVIVVSCIASKQISEHQRDEAAADSQRLAKLRNDEMQKAAIAKCRQSISAMKSEYSKLFESQQYWKAARVIETCHTTLDDPELKALVAQAETQEYMTVASDAKQPPGDRVAAIEALKRTYPDKAGPFIPLIPALQSRADQAAADAWKKAEKVRLAQRKKEGVTLGMTEEEVLQSSWGKPDKINRSHGSYGTHEQWVYRERSSGYLYFENGKLTSVQN